MKDDKLDENSSVEIIDERKQRLHTSRMDTRLRTPVREEKRWAGGKRRNTSDGENTIG